MEHRRYAKLFSITASGLYKVAVGNVCNIINDSVTVAILTVPSIDFSNQYLTCQYTPLQLTATTYTGANYAWSNGRTTAGVSLSSEGKYTLTVSNAYFSAQKTFEIKQLKVSDYKPVADTILCNQNILPFKQTMPETKFFYQNKLASNPLKVLQGLNTLTITNPCFTITDTFNIQIIPKEPRPFSSDTAICYKMKLF